MNEKELREGPVGRLYFSYALPAILGMLVSGVYVIVDGAFIGHALGADGLAAMNFAYPVYSLLVALGLLIGLGSSSIISRLLGAGEKDKAAAVLRTAFYFLFCSAIVLSIVGLLFLEPILGWLGAEEATVSMAADYCRVVLANSLFVLLATALDHLIRNDGFPRFAMALMIFGALINIALDALFIIIWDWGLAGAAWGTIIAQIVVSVVFVAHFLGHRSRIRFQPTARPLFLRSRVSEIIRTGMAAFVIEASVALMIIVHNRRFTHYGTLLDVSAYGIVGYIISIFIMINIGLSNGMQPIISYNFGAGLHARVRKTLRIALGVNLAFGVVSTIFMARFPREVIYLFNSTDELLIGVAEKGMMYYLLIILLGGVNMCMAGYFIAIGKNRAALLASLIRSNLYLFPLLFILPPFIGTRGIWLASPLSEVFAFFTIMWMLKRSLDKRLD